jgi:hypothetical protein
LRKWVILDTEQIEMKCLVGFGLIFSRDDKKLGFIKKKLILKAATQFLLTKWGILDVKIEMGKYSVGEGLPIHFGQKKKKKKKELA